MAGFRVSHGASLPSQLEQKTTEKMRINITDQMISQFFSGLTVVFVLIAIGAVLAFVLKGMAGKSPFTRMALILALAPVSLISFLGYKESTYVFIYAMVAVLIGLTIDGINYLLAPKPELKSEPVKAEEEKEAEEENPNVIVWEKAE